MTDCLVGHTHHELQLVPIPEVGTQMWIFDSDQYENMGNYCPGDSAVSRTLQRDHYWERWNTNLILRRGVFRGGTVVDIGANMGWYTLLAASHGCNVIAIEADPDFAEVLRMNVELNGFTDLVDIRHEKVTQGWSLDLDKADFIKIDIEGSDILAVEGMWETDVTHWMVEMSPVFGHGYPELAQKFLDAGYEATIIGENERPLPSAAWVETCHQVDILYSKKTA